MFCKIGRTHRGYLAGRFLGVLGARIVGEKRKGKEALKGEVA